MKAETTESPANVESPRHDTERQDAAQCDYQSHALTPEQRYQRSAEAEVLRARALVKCFIDEDS
jgi:hypothetical protein